IRDRNVTGVQTCALPISQIVAFSRAGDSQLDRVAISMDVRGCRTRQEVQAALDQLDLQQVPYKVLFLDASDEVLCRRYKETRRRSEERRVGAAGGCRRWR